MELKFLENQVEIEKELNELDKFVIKFTDILNKLNIKYVIVSGYVSIIFGRNRSSEDIDLIIEKLDYDKFNKLWHKILYNFDCIITENQENAYFEYLLKDNSIRFAERGKFIPNIEIKFPKTELDKWTLQNPLKASLNDNLLFISKIELQIPFKFFLGSEKDIEDAKYLYAIFKNHLDIELLEDFNRKLKIVELFNKYIKTSKNSLK
jgi:hypothetical protein